MLGLWQKTIESETWGSRTIQVECEKCHCSYYYLLTRRGRGFGVHNLSVDLATATKVANEQSQSSLKKRLGNEAEPVPCPKCNWINADLVEGYRLSRFESLSSMALGIGLWGTTAMLALAFCSYIKPGFGQSWALFFLIAGPPITLPLGASLIILRDALRRRIHPNRDFDLHGTLPRGTPLAWIQDRTTGELRLVARKSRGEDRQGIWVEFWIGRDSFPDLCCCCLGTPTPGSEVS